MNKFSLVGTQLYLKIYKENSDVSSEGPSSGVTERRAFARNVEILLTYFQVVASLPTKACLYVNDSLSDLLGQPWKVATSDSLIEMIRGCY